MIFKRVLSLITVILLLTLSFVSCAKSNNVKISEMTLEELEEYISIGEYKNVEISLGENSKQEALLLYIDKNSSVKHYPESARSARAANRPPIQTTVQKTIEDPT